MTEHRIYTNFAFIKYCNLLLWKPILVSMYGALFPDLIYIESTTKSFKYLSLSFSTTKYQVGNSTELSKQESVTYSGVKATILNSKLVLVYHLPPFCIFVTKCASIYLMKYIDEIYDSLLLFLDKNKPYI